MTKEAFLKLKTGDQIELKKTKDSRNFPIGIYTIMKKEENILIIKGSHKKNEMLAIGTNAAIDIEKHIAPEEEVEKEQCRVEKKTTSDVAEGSTLLELIQATIDIRNQNDWKLSFVQTLKENGEDCVLLYFKK